MFHSCITTRSKLKSSAHCLGAMAIRIDSYSAEGVFPTQTQTCLREGTLGHRWYCSSKVTGPPWTINTQRLSGARSIKTCLPTVRCQVAQNILAHGHSGLWPSPPPFGVIAYISVTGPNRATRLRGSIIPTKCGTAFNMTWGPTTIGP